MLILGDERAGGLRSRHRNRLRAPVVFASAGLRACILGRFFSGGQREGENRNLAVAYRRQFSMRNDKRRKERPAKIALKTACSKRCSRKYGAAKVGDTTARGGRQIIAGFDNALRLCAQRKLISGPIGQLFPPKSTVSIVPEVTDC